MGLATKMLVAILVMLTGVLQYRLWLSDGGVPTILELRRTLNDQTQGNARQKTENQRLMAEVRDLRKSGEAMEERARSELGMIKDGESFYLAIERHH